MRAHARDNHAAGVVERGVADEARWPLGLTLAVDPEVIPGKSNVPEDVLRYARYDNDTDGFVVPPAHELRSFRIVVVTLSTAGKLPNLGVCNHFTVSFFICCLSLPSIYET